MACVLPVAVGDVGEKLDFKVLKTKIRRLYDIANVLQSIGLIKKCQASDEKKTSGHKPAFEWIGLEGSKTSINDIKVAVREGSREAEP